ncbi:CNP1-like family protein [Pseudorhodoferax sp. Leaf267]|uniref:CNP1-like family protein n=1 Tax=Pseudorhodoferax sp. Leaf267 TaxID=1736316 RepID=UPI0007126904|nr:CNP1-like family protein [Pseudorhodoferax sp. Leaf267]KQP17818.1 hypothetical protein ASF43_08070 [Pseudorhodoferax sp. Leaf267]
MHLRSGRIAAWLAVGALSASMALAQTILPDQPDWAEADVPPPPTFQTDKLISVDVDKRGSLQYGVDPATMSIGKDGVVRYVIVARSPSGAMTAMYEGLRCGTGEHKVYARYNDARWAPVASPQWQSLFDSTRVRYPLALARQGGCDSKAPPTSVSDMVRKLKNPAPIVYPG